VLATRWQIEEIKAGVPTKSGCYRVPSLRSR
jgi:hypothetical protein